MAIHLALVLALIETLALAAVLRVWARQVPGAGLLQVFLLGVALWIVGNELPNAFGPPAMDAAMTLLATAPLSAAAFLHFCLRLCGLPARRPVLVLAYGAGAAVLALCLVVSPGHFAPFAGITWVPIPSAAGWVTSIVWGLLAASGIGVLLWGVTHAPDAAAFRQAHAVLLSCGWGLFCMSGYGIAALDLPFYPWPLLGLPAYPLILVYGILRYRVFIANAWARRAVAWALLLLAGALLVPLTLLLPVESRWLGGAAVALVCLVLNGPVRRLAERLVYPGASTSPADLAAWRQALAQAETLPALAEHAARLLSQRLGTPIAVRIGETGAGAAGDGDAGTAGGGHPGASGDGHSAASGDAEAGLPLLHCAPVAGDAPNVFVTRLQGWDDAPPGPRHLAEFFGGVLAEAAAQVQRAQAAGERERERQLQARLAELGALAATVAHDIRNPLNIISMAVALAPAETRQEVAGQVKRLSRLAEDLLDYAKPWQLRRSRFDLAQRVRELVRREPAVTLTPAFESQAWIVDADPQRVDQVLANLLANARSAAGEQAVQLDIDRAADGTLQLHVCDRGPGVPPDLRDKLFQPFASRSPGGTGLGLAIVARIMAAHGGSVALTERPGWTTCFTLRFPP